MLEPTRRLSGPTRGCHLHLDGTSLATLALCALVAFWVSAVRPSLARAQATPEAAIGDADDGAPDSGEEAETPTSGHVVPPGQEELIADMLGRGTQLPGDCRWTGGDAAGPRIRATYACGGSEVVLELQHLEDTPGGAARTDQFAVVVTGGSPPPGLVDALVARIRQRESGFHWLSLAPPIMPASSHRFWILTVAVLLIAVWAWRRRRRQRSTEPPPAA